MTEAQATAKAQYGGIKIGSAFLGFAAAYGVAVLLTGIVTYVALLFDAVVLTPTGLQDLFGRVSPEPSLSAGVLAYVLGLVVVLVAYYLGGYVAGRMARFHGARQGVAVWAWGLLISVALVILTLSVGPGRVPIRDLVASIEPAALLGVLVILVAQLVGAVLGGMTGMRFHRRVDRAELVAPADR